MSLWTKSVLKPMLFPGAALVLVSAVLLRTGLLALAAPTILSAFFILILGGLLLAWRFHSSRVFFALITLLLAQQAIVQFSSAHGIAPAARVALEAASILVPLNFILLAFIRERGFTSESLTPLAITLFVESVIVSVLCRGVEDVRVAKHHALAAAPALPTYAWAAFAAAAAILLGRFLLSRKPVEIGFLWSLVGFFLALNSGGTSPASAVYFTTASLILGLSIVETSYMLAYHDELTGLPSRRAFNDALLRLQTPYTVAVVDIDHFKKFNDTYGHDTGDEVLRLVASKLAGVTGGGKAFRCGGEEFNIVFSGKTTAEVVDHLEKLRAAVESANFRMRGRDRRKTPRGPDRRQPAAGRKTKKQSVNQLELDFSTPQVLSVTVSIGVATSSAENADAEQVIKAADVALYRAKEGGRNRVEAASVQRRTRTKSAGIA